MNTGPNMATITAALERSLQNCSLSRHHHHHHHHQVEAVTAVDSHGNSSSFSEIPHQNQNQNQNQNHLHLFQPPSSDTTLDLNSHISLPYHWEQCLDLKTGEIYYINWRNGMKAKEDPRSTAEDQYSEDSYSDDSSYDSEESSTESSNNNNNNNKKNNNFAMEAQQEGEEEEEDHVLVVAGCKSCLMYFMVPKHLEDCPKCSTGQLLHFDRSENDIP